MAKKFDSLNKKSFARTFPKTVVCLPRGNRTGGVKFPNVLICPGMSSTFFFVCLTVTVIGCASRTAKEWLHVLFSVRSGDSTVFEKIASVV